MELTCRKKSQIEELLEVLRRSFYVGLDKGLRDKIEGIPKN
jgi:hypothetical protein